MLFVFGISVNKIFFTSGKFSVDDKITANEITEIQPENYTNVLQAVHEDIDSYIGSVYTHAVRINRVDILFSVGYDTNVLYPYTLL